MDPTADNDAIDQRQELTDQLASLVGIQVSTDSHNNYQITLDTGAATLVSGGTAYQMSATPDAANGNNYQVTVATGNLTTDVTDQINGRLSWAPTWTSGTTSCPATMTQLDSIAGSLASTRSTPSTWPATAPAQRRSVRGTAVLHRHRHRSPGRRQLHRQLADTPMPASAINTRLRGIITRRDRQPGPWHRPP